MNENFQNLIDTLRQVSLSGNEKREIKALVFERISEKREPGRQFAAERYSYDIFAIFRSHALAFTTAMFVIFAGAGVSFGAENALPGDALYPVKIHVNEGLRGAVVFNPIQEAKWNSKRIERRLMEAQELAKEGRLEGEAEEVIEENFVAHTSKVYEAVDKIGNSQDVTVALDIVSDLESLLSAHQEVLASRLAKSRDLPEKPRTLKEFQESKTLDGEGETETEDSGIATSSLEGVTEEETSTSSESFETEPLQGEAAESLAERVAEKNQTLLDILENSIVNASRSRIETEGRLGQMTNQALRNSAIRAQRKAEVALSVMERSYSKMDSSLYEKNSNKNIENDIRLVENILSRANGQVEVGNYSTAIKIFNEGSRAAQRFRVLIEAQIELEVIKDTANEIEAKVNGEALGSSTSTTEVGTTTEDGDLGEGASEGEETGATSTPEESEEGSAESQEEIGGEKDEQKGDGNKNTLIKIDLL